MNDLGENKTNGKAHDPVVACCAPDVVLECSQRMAAIERRLGELAQSAREQSEALNTLAATLERRNEALDRLTSRIVLSDAGIVVEDNVGRSG